MLQRDTGLIPGCPDCLGAARGQMVALELKAEKGRLSETQIATQQRMRDAGGLSAWPTT
jgi:hypothetical protein